MMSSQTMFVKAAIFILISHFVGAEVPFNNKCLCDEALINRQGFPDDFMFGVSTSAYQIEGGFDEDGKGQSIWDTYAHHIPNRIIDNNTGDVAADSYHLYKEDVQLMKNMGLDAYRFSINWARILPGGSRAKGVNQAGLAHYSNLINELLANGIEPWVTMLHMDYPQALEDAYGGFLSRKIVADFEDLADVLFAEFGDRVKYWITINEPWGLSVLGYSKGIFAPGRCTGVNQLGQKCLGGDSGVEPYIVNHNQLLAHAAVVKLYRNKYQELQNGMIGIIVNSHWFVPYNETELNSKATERALEFMLGLDMDPLVFGRYPLSVQERVGSLLPKFTEDEIELVKGSFDFIGLNYYSALYVVDASNSTIHLSYEKDVGVTYQRAKDGVQIGERGSSIRNNYAYPKGLRDILRYMKERYGDLFIYITENGIDEDRTPMPSTLQDYKRKQNFYEHLCCLREAITNDGANVKGYFAWSFLDDFEFTCGLKIQYGLYYVDYSDKSRRRTPKQSALWFKSILEKGIKEPKSGTNSYSFISKK